MCKYLVNNPERGMIYKVDETKGLDVYIDADFAGGWNAIDSDNAENVMSRTGFIISYVNYQVVWSRKHQTEIALSTAEAEHIALLQALHEVIPVQNMKKEFNCIFPLYTPKTNFCLTVHEDNQSTIMMA